jgi:nicotinamide mononucleotide (NMN) deamidase PncC
MLTTKPRAPAPLDAPDALLLKALQERLHGMMQHDAETLRECRFRLAHVLHPALLEARNRGLEGVVIIDPACPGKPGDALAANNGCSKYLKGTYAHYSPAAAAHQTADALDSFLAISPGSRAKMLTATAAKNGSNYEAYVSQSNTPAAIVRIPITTAPSSECTKELASLACLSSVASWLAGHNKDAAFRSACELALHSPATTSDKLHQEAVRIRRATTNAWRILRDSGSSLPECIVGESFTLGKVADLLSGSDATSPLRVSYGWYDPEYKAAVGVPREFLTDDLIAEPCTVIAGARGLLQKYGDEHTVAIATSGWANFWRAGESDYFSVAVASGVRHERLHQARRFVVDATKGESLDTGRRAVTRELGAAVAISMVTEHLAQKGLISAALHEQVVQELDTTIRAFGRFSGPSLSETTGNQIRT